MKPQHAICNGNDLAAVLGELKARGCLVESLDTGVNTNAGYQVNFVERVSELAPSLAVRQCVDGRILPEGENPSVLNTDSVAQMDAHPRKRLAQAGLSTRKDASSSLVTVGQFPQQGETPASLLATVAVKNEVAPRIPIIGVKIPFQTPAFDAVTLRDKPPEREGGAEAVAVGSIATRLAVLQSKLAKAGKLRRSKPQHVRLPYRDL